MLKIFIIFLIIKVIISIIIWRNFSKILLWVTQIILFKMDRIESKDEYIELGYKSKRIKIKLK